MEVLTCCPDLLLGPPWQEQVLRNPQGSSAVSGPLSDRIPKNSKTMHSHVISHWKKKKKNENTLLKYLV